MKHLEDQIKCRLAAALHITFANELRYQRCSDNTNLLLVDAYHRAQSILIFTLSTDRIAIR